MPGAPPVNGSTTQRETITGLHRLGANLITLSPLAIPFTFPSLLRDRVERPAGVKGAPVLAIQSPCVRGHDRNACPDAGTHRWALLGSLRLREGMVPQITE